VPGQPRVPDRVDAAVDAVEAASRRRPGDRVLRIAQRSELSRRDDPMLAGSEIGERSIPPLRSSLVAHTATRDERIAQPILEIWRIGAFTSVRSIFITPP